MDPHMSKIFMAIKTQIDKALAGYAAAAARGRARGACRDLASSAHYEQDRHRIHVELVSGSAVAIQVKHLQGLSRAKPPHLRNVTIVGRGFGLYWPDLDARAREARRLSHIFGQGRRRPGMSFGYLALQSSAVAVAFAALSATAVAEPMQLIVLGGQSNAEGTRTDALMLERKADIDRSVRFFWQIPGGATPADGRRWFLNTAALMPGTLDRSSVSRDGGVDRRRLR